MAGEFITDGIKIGTGVATKDGTTIEVEGHKAKHEDGGADEISIAGLSGVAADLQNPVVHDINGASHSGGTAILSGDAAGGDLDGTLPSPSVIQARGGLLLFTADGRPVLVNTAWSDEPVAGAVIRPGAVAPTAKDYLGVRHLHFAVNDEASVSCQLSHAWKPGTSVYPHVHIGLAVAPGATANLKFRAAGYRSVAGSVANSWGPIDVEIAVGGEAQYYEAYISFGALDMSSYAQESAIIGYKLTRIAASSDEYAGGTAEAALLSADCHLELSAVGTAQQLPPYTK